MPRKPSRNGGSAAGIFDPKSLIPDSFMLAGTVWTVKRSHDIAELGRCERDAATILIRDGISEQVMLSTFCHELIHAIKFAQGLTDHDEKDVDAMGQFLHQFFVTRS